MFWQSDWACSITWVQALSWLSQFNFDRYRVLLILKKKPQHKLRLSMIEEEREEEEVWSVTKVCLLKLWIFWIQPQQMRTRPFAECWNECHQKSIPMQFLTWNPLRPFLCRFNRKKPGCWSTWLFHCPLCLYKNNQKKSCARKCKLLTPGNLKALKRPYMRSRTLFRRRFFLSFQGGGQGMPGERGAFNTHRVFPNAG